MFQLLIIRHKLSLLFILAIAFIIVGMGSSPSYAQEDDFKILAWIGNGAAPDQQSPDALGQIVYLTQEDDVEVLIDLPQGTNRVIPCTEQATSPDGQYFTFFAGAATGTLYQVTGAHTPVAINEGVSALACLGMGTFRYSPDSNRLGYIDYEKNPPQASTVNTGWLYVLDSTTHDPIYTTNTPEASGEDNVATFDINNHALAFVSLYAGGEEAAIFYKTDERMQPDEISTLSIDGCEFRNLEIKIIDEDRLALLVAKYCTGNNSSEWGLYIVNTAYRSTNRTSAKGNTGAYNPTVRSNAMLVSPDAETLYPISPNGADFQFITFQAIDLSHIPTGPGEILADIAVLRRSNDNIYNRGLHAPPILSPDRRWFAIVSESAPPPAINTAIINVIDLNTPELPAITISAANPDETISAMAFLPDSSALLFVIGGNNGEKNTLFALDLVSALESRVMRAEFGQQIVISPDKQYAALPNWRIVQAENQPNYLTLRVINLETGDFIPIFSGAEVVDDVVSNLQFVYPLSWRE